MRRNNTGFTRTELLVAIGMLLLVLALVLPAINLARRKADSIGCQNNLKQTAQAIHEYARLNGQWLPPGPNATYGLDRTHRSVYREDLASQGQLAYHLATYLRLPAPDARTRDSLPLRCPAAVRGANPSNVAAYAVGTGAAVLVPPFGRGTEVTPRRINDLLLSIKNDELWMLSDVDRENAPTEPPGDVLPAAPAHAAYRNVAYFDGHVTSILLSKATIDSIEYAK